MARTNTGPIRVDRLLTGLLIEDREDLRYDWGDDQPFRIGVGPGECDNAPLVDSKREDPRAGPAAWAIDADALRWWLQTAKPPRIVDVRSEAEFVQGHLPQAVWVPPGQLAEYLAGFSPEDCFVMVCRSGRRSAAVAAQLRGQGFARVFHLHGGLRGWGDSWGSQDPRQWSPWGQINE